MKSSASIRYLRLPNGCNIAPLTAVPFIVACISVAAVSRPYTFGTLAKL
jgi:hypothetical protein